MPCSTSFPTPCASSTTPTPATDRPPRSPSFHVCDKNSETRSSEILSQTWIWAPVAWAVVLRLVLPKGSLEKATLDLFEAADLPVSRSSSVDYQGTIDDPRIASVRILRPQEIPVYVAEGLFDIGITGRDWIEETGSDVVSLGELKYSKATARPIKLVVAVAGDSTATSVEGPPRRRARAVRVPGADQALLRRSRCASRRPALLRRDRSEDPRHRRLRRRDHRDGPSPAGGGPEGDRHDPDELHRSRRQSGLRRRSRQAQGDGSGDDAAQRRARRPRQGAAEAERRARTATTRSSPSSRR